MQASSSTAIEKALAAETGRGPLRGSIRSAGTVFCAGRGGPCGLRSQPLARCAAGGAGGAGRRERCAAREANSSGGRWKIGPRTGVGPVSATQRRYLDWPETQLDILAQLEPPTAPPNDYDQRVPVILFGEGIKPGRYTMCRNSSRHRADTGRRLRAFASLGPTGASCGKRWRPASG